MSLKAAALIALAFGCAHGAAPVSHQLKPDSDAIAEAKDSFEPERYVSARAYQHYLDALLARGADDYATAASELREALLYDAESPHLHTVLAEVLLKQGRVADAEEELRTALSLDPAHAPARLLMARIAEARDRPVEARNHLRAAIEGAPQDPDAYRELVRMELALGDLAAAEEVAGKLAEATRSAQQQAQKQQHDEEPDESRGAELVTADRMREQAAGAWVDVARAMIQRHDDGGAQRAFAQARAAQPSDPEALAAEASFLESQRKFAGARELYLRLLAQRPEAPEVLASLARVALEEGDLDTVTAHARKLLGLAAEVPPWDGTTTERDEDRRDLAGALLRLAVPLLGARRSAEAQDALEGALRLYPNHAELAFYRAMALVQRGHPREGAAGFEQVEKTLRARKGDAPSPELLGISPEALLLDARVQAALARGRAGETQESMQRLRVLFAENPQDEAVPLALLEAYDRAGRAAEAEQMLAAAARQLPGSDSLLYALGNAQDRAGMRSVALATMRKVLALQPQHSGALNYIGYTLTEQGGSAELREAERLLARAVELRPDDGAIADSYGFCLLKLGRNAESLVELRRADKLAPGDPVILSHLGDALLAAGKRAEALQAFHDALGRLQPAAGTHRVRKPASAAFDPPDRLPEPGDAKVRSELLQKLKALNSSP
ncbi:MAG: tetratricopeptide repeat protein [Myxococcales bacterium]|nr:tetratricopeptide repeat protein [Myxococcales bacterium]